jgi:hypothetical protein
MLDRNFNPFNSTILLGEFIADRQLLKQTGRFDPYHGEIVKTVFGGPD